MSAGSMFGTVLNFLIIGGVCAVIGAVIAIFIGMTASYDLPQAAVNTLWYLELIFFAFPFIYLIANWLNHIITSSSETDQLV